MLSERPINLVLNITTAQPAGGGAATATSTESERFTVACPQPEGAWQARAMDGGREGKLIL